MGHYGVPEGELLPTSDIQEWWTGRTFDVSVDWGYKTGNDAVGVTSTVYASGQGDRWILTIVNNIHGDDSFDYDPNN